MKVKKLRALIVEQNAEMAFLILVETLIFYESSNLGKIAII